MRWIVEHHPAGSGGGVLGIDIVAVKEDLRTPESLAVDDFDRQRRAAARRSSRHFKARIARRRGDNLDKAQRLVERETRVIVMGRQSDVIEVHV